MGKITSTVPKIKDFDRDENIGLRVYGQNNLYGTQNQRF